MRPGSQGRSQVDSQQSAAQPLNGAWAAGASLGASHSCAITTGNALYCWDYNGKGGVGDGTTTNRLTPKNIA